MEQFNKRNLTIGGKETEAEEQAAKQGRLEALEQRLAEDDSHENWLDLESQLRTSLHAQEDPEFRAKLEALIQKSQWSEWSEKMRGRDNEVADQLLKMQKETGITDMSKLEELLSLSQTDEAKFAAIYSGLINKN